ncbi:hypothetical protein BDM02DRAFT_3145869 [Thelephora ganbajun]|uniref:Uncharacterized protein n=1 Tax=Thelephora ganbajun TaxID=370292 RepID=A0ACB6ZDE2_THEGA|nr:hypothetical protein BDM02DRAFT_3145869 [Thelephora ganbajun]
MFVVVENNTTSVSEPGSSQIRSGSAPESDWNLLSLPPEIILRILSYLDIPDLTSLSRASPQLVVLTSDPILHRNRLRLTAPSRVAHSLFGTSPNGILLRPSVGELLQRGVMKGLGIERRWRTGGYFYSPRMVSVYENALRVHRLHAQNLISTVLRGRLQSSNPSAVVPPHSITGRSDIYVTEGLKRSKPGVVSRTLLPTIRSLRWNFKRDQVSRVVRGASGIGALFAKRKSSDDESDTSDRNVAIWIEKQGPKLIPDSSSGLEVERTRLALCPDVGKIIKFYEGLSVDD